jgi:hypothetical protein
MEYIKSYRIGYYQYIIYYGQLGFVLKSGNKIYYEKKTEKLSPNMG